MGKGDKKSKRGKISIGSFGVTRPRKKTKPGKGVTVPKLEKTDEIKEKKAAKKPAVKKPKKESAE